MRSGELAKALEPTLLRPNALVSEIDELCTLAEREHVACVVVFPVWVSYARSRLEGTDVRVCAVGVSPARPGGGRPAARVRPATAHRDGGGGGAGRPAGAAEAGRDGAHD